MVKSFDEAAATRGRSSIGSMPKEFRGGFLIGQRWARRDENRFKVDRRRRTAPLLVDSEAMDAVEGRV